MPFVHYICPCTTVPVKPTGPETPSAAMLLTTPLPQSTPTDLGLPATPQFSDLPSDTTLAYSQPQSRLLFCEDCQRLKCDRCLFSEINCYYCPNCLFEVPTASVKNERNRCMRNCFQCPTCQSVLSVVAEESTLTTLSGMTSTTQGRYYLLCSFCRFDSRDLAPIDPALPNIHQQPWTFDRPTGLASITQKEDDARWDVLQFEWLRDVLEQRIRKAHQHPSQARSSFAAGAQKTASDAGSLVDEFLRSAQRPAAPPTPLSRQNTLQGVVEEDDQDSLHAFTTTDTSMEANTVEELMRLTDADEISTLEQRFQQLSDQPYLLSHIRPQRVLLRTKRTYRCRSCRHVAIKPEQKATAHTFKIANIALHYVPVITIQQLPQLRVGELSRVVLKFSNPVYYVMNIKTKVRPQETLYDVRMPASEFQIAEYGDMWEYEEELFSSGARSLAAVSRTKGGVGADGRTGTLPMGIWEIKSHNVSCMLELLPKREFRGETDEDGLAVDIWVWYHYVELPEEHDFLSESEDEFDQEDKSSFIENKDEVAKKTEKIDMSDMGDSVEQEGIAREGSFWIHVNLGKVVAAAPTGLQGKTDAEAAMILGY